MTLFSKLISSLLVVLIAATASVLLLFSHGDALRQDIDRYPAGSTALQLFGVAEDRSAAVLSAFGEFIEANGAAVVRVDRESSKVDGGLTGMRIGIATDPHAPLPALDFSFLGTTFLDAPKLTRLLTSDPGKSIGLDANAADVVSDVPQLAFAPRLVVLQLARLVETSGTINGTYRVVGADEGRLAELVASLEQATGRPAATLTSELRGESSDAGLAQLIVQWFLIAASLLLLFLLVFEAVRASRVLGVLLLLGRSRWGFTLTLFRPVVIATAFALPLSMVLTIVFAPGFGLNASLVVAAASSAAATAVIALLCAAVAATVLLSIKPVDAILRRYSKKLLLAVLAFFYVSSVAGFSLAFAALDGPLEEAGDLSEVSRAWADYADQRILYRESPGNDAASFSGQSSRHAQDFYSWYAAIADEPGVALVNTAHY
ncbi:hypothetical protein GNZ10_25345, partial [Ralstonia sp. 3N]|uniref:hypothetical protein n=1 Tax=Ralstonia sp. 3N TaxID=2675750 RepID=UPI0015C54266